jgi:hypothetical protein
MANDTIKVCETPQNTGNSEEPLSKGESAAMGALGALPLATVDCRKKLAPFACLYLFPLQYDGNGPGVSPTARSCKVIRDDVCKEEWKIAQRFSDFLPVCEMLKEDRIDILQSCTG